MLSAVAVLILLGESATAAPLSALVGNVFFVCEPITSLPKKGASPMTIAIPKQTIECSNVIAGKRQEGGGATIAVESPYSGTVIGQIRESTSEDVAQAVTSAQEAQSEWGSVPIKERTRIMFAFRDILLRDIDLISERVSLENGKTFGESKAGLLKGIEVLEFALSLQNLDQGGKMEVSRGVSCEYRRRPLGVVAGITPFNFPAMVPMWMIPIAITLGNAFLWKPSEKTPLTSMMIADAANEAGLPAGILTVVQGGKTTVESILDAKGVSAVGFVGSTAVAKSVYQRGSAAGKRVLALGGAKNHIFLLPDADPEIAAQGIGDAFTGCAGQRCMAASVLLAVGDVDHIIDAMIRHVSEKKLGTDMGAVISKQQVEFLSKAIGEAEKKGAKILLDGRGVQAPSGYENGYWMGPTVLDQVKPGDQAACQELFGPIISIVRCRNLSEAIEVENQNPYGNAASVFTRSGPLAERVVRAANAGMLGVNIGVPVPREPFSFAGINDSKFGHGEITGHGSLDFWSDLQKVTVKWEQQSDQNWMS